LDDKFEKGYVRMAKCNLLMGNYIFVFLTFHSLYFICFAF